MKNKNHRTFRFVSACFAALLLFVPLLAALPLTANASGEPGMPGDLTLDGRIDATDYLLLKRCVLGTYTPDSAQRLCADLNKDGSIDVKDYLLLKNMILENTKLPQTGTGNGQTDASEPQSGKTDSEAEEVLRLVNEQRAKNGLAALTLSDKLCELAELKAEDMVANGYFDHTSPTYGTPFDMLKQFGVPYRSAGENIAAGQSTPEEVMNDWMNSAGHRANILNAGYTELGVGIAVGQRGIYWVQLFRMS